MSLEVLNYDVLMRTRELQQMCSGPLRQSADAKGRHQNEKGVL
jgi:hypothetical protein